MSKAQWKISAVHHPHNLAKRLIERAEGPLFGRKCPEGGGDPRSIRGRASSCPDRSPLRPMVQISASLLDLLFYLRPRPGQAPYAVLF